MNLTEALEKISALEADLVAANAIVAEAAQTGSDLEVAHARIAELETAAAESAQSLELVIQTLSEAQSEIESLRAVDADVTTRANAIAAQIVAAQATAPVANTQKEESSIKHISRAEFDRMDDFERSKFLRAGGRVTK